jgi:TolB-like protein
MRISRGILLALLIVGMTMISGEGVWAQSGGKAKMAEAFDLFKSANFDKAIEILKPLVDDKTLDNKDKKEILLTLGRAYMAKGDRQNAFWAMGRLLDLEPPLITPDPDAEAPPLMNVYYEARKSKAGNMQIEDRADPGIKTIAILDFANRSIDDKEKYDPLEKGLAELMIHQLDGSINLKVVERERIKWILGELELENDPGKFDPQSAVRLGKQLGVHTVLLGTMMKIKNKMKLLARLVKVETSEIIATEEAQGDVDDILEIAENLSMKVAKKINVTLTKADVEKSGGPNSLEAMMLFSEGLKESDKGNYKGAYDKFMQAFQVDPQYEKAKQRAEALKPLIG